MLIRQIGSCHNACSTTEMQGRSLVLHQKVPPFRITMCLNFFIVVHRRPSTPQSQSGIYKGEVAFHFNLSHAQLDYLLTHTPQNIFFSIRKETENQLDVPNSVLWAAYGSIIHCSPFCRIQFEYM